jgi:hypothetical protein
MPPDRFEAGRDIDAIAVKVRAVDDDVAEIDADAVEQAAGRGEGRVALRQGRLQLESGRGRFDDTGEFHENAVADEPDDAALVLENLRLDDLTQLGFERTQGPRLVFADEPGIADYISKHDSREPPVHPVLRSSWRALRRLSV